jgi:hypothetical protein
MDEIGPCLSTRASPIVLRGAMPTVPLVLLLLRPVDQKTAPVAH